MSRSYFEAGAERAARVRELFSTIAWRYDLLNDLQSFGLHRYWKRRLVELGRPKPGLRAIDVCCGTGDLTFSLARQGVDAIGLDFSQPMLEVARRRASAGLAGQRTFPTSGKASLSPGQISFVWGDAQELPFPDESFDIVTMGYGLRNLADWRTGLQEMKRVAKRGGRLLALDFGKPENRVWRRIYFGYLKLFIPMLGLIFCRNLRAYSYILESLHLYPAQHGVAAGMGELALTNVQIISFLGGVMTINYAEKA